MQGAIWIEAVKAVGQLLGAGVIAYLTVRWALGRYKKEKVWERQVATLAELIEALTEMGIVQSLLCGEHIPDEEGREPDRDDIWIKELNRRSDNARARINAAAANGTIFFSEAINAAIVEYRIKAEEISGEWMNDEISSHEAYERNYYAVEKLRSFLIKEARSVTQA